MCLQKNILKKGCESSAKNNLSNSTSLANNGIHNLQQLSKVNNHDFRKYENNSDYVYQLKDTNDIVYDVKEFYKKEFEEARLEYNNKQSRSSRRIDDYFEYVNKDETSPHMHIVGVPVKNGCKTGLSKQVNKSAVFTKERLEHIQNVMRKKCIERFNIAFKDEKAILKVKETGRNNDIHVKDMANYQELKKELEINKKSIDKNNDKIKSINNTSKELKDLLSNLDESRFGGCKLNNKQKERLQDLIKDVESLTSYFDNYKNIINNLSSINDNLKYQKDRNKKLENDNDKILKENIKLKDENKILKYDKNFIKSVMDKRMDERKDFITYLCKGVNSKDSIISRQFKYIADDMHKKKFISRKERFVIFNPPRLISKSEIEIALHHINQQMEYEAEYHRQQRVKEMSGTNENDYTL